MIKSLDYVTLFVDDLPSCLAFYRDVLGLPVVQTSDRFALLDAGACRIGLNGSTGGDSAGGVNPHFRVDDVEAACAWLRRRGAAIAEPPRNMPWSVRSVTMHDPAGHRVELVSPTKPA